jgi:hypothetical protein
VRNLRPSVKPRAAWHSPSTNASPPSRLENEAVLDRMAARLKARPEILDRRLETVEHPFGSIKQWMPSRNSRRKRAE